MCPKVLHGFLPLLYSTPLSDSFIDGLDKMTRPPCIVPLEMQDVTKGNMAPKIVHWPTTMQSPHVYHDWLGHQRISCRSHLPCNKRTVLFYLIRLIYYYVCIKQANTHLLPELWAACWACCDSESIHPKPSPLVPATPASAQIRVLSICNLKWIRLPRRLAFSCGREFNTDST